MAWQPTTQLEALMFRPLSDAEEREFRAYARTHQPESWKWTIYHPVCRDEWTKCGRRH